MGARDGRTKQDMTGLVKVRFSVLVDMSVDQRPTLIWTGNIYDIYQQEVPEMDMSSHLMRWLNFLEARLGRPLVKDDYVFPYFAPNGAPHPKRAMSYDTLQNTLTEFSAAAGLDKQYTTHCFRRGGAQYRFMHAPLGKRWSLSMV
jgi:hypothetical protein